MPAAIEVTREPADPIVRAGADKLAQLMRAARPEQEADQAQEAKPRKILPLPPFTSSDLCEARRATFFRALPPGVTLEDLLDDDTRAKLFSVACEKLRTNDEITLRLENALVEIFIVESQFGSAQTVVRRVDKLPPRASHDIRAIPVGFTITQNHASRWIITRLSDGVLMNGEDGDPTFEAARQNLINHASLRQSPQ